MCLLGAGREMSRAMPRYKRSSSCDWCLAHSEADKVNAFIHIVFHPEASRNAAVAWRPSE